MKLFEFSVLVRVTVVLAAPSEEIAEGRIRSMSVLEVLADCDVLDVADIDLTESRGLSPSELNSLDDLAHEVIHG